MDPLVRGRGCGIIEARPSMDRIPAAPLVTPVRLHAWYSSARALLRELSRALNQGQTLLRADSGLPVGTHVVLVMAADCLSSPLEVEGTVTARRVRGARHEMTLRYDFDAGPQRHRLDEALAELQAETRRPRRVPRVPLTLSTDAATLGRDLEVTLIDLSATGARMQLVGRRLPKIEPGSRLRMSHRGRREGVRHPLRLTLEVRWLGPQGWSGGERHRLVGGRFVRLSEAMRRRLHALLRFDETRPGVRLESIDPPPIGPSRRRRSILKR
jgi:hypothetical protein